MISSTIDIRPWLKKLEQIRSAALAIEVALSSGKITNIRPDDLMNINRAHSYLLETMKEVGDV